MRNNVEKVIDRDVKLSELDDRADALQQGASQFETQAAKLKRKYWWKNMQMWIIIGVVVVIIGIVMFMSSKKDQQMGQFMNQMPPQQMAQQPLMPQPGTVGQAGQGSIQVQNG